MMNNSKTSKMSVNCKKKEKKRKNLNTPKMMM